MKERRTSKVLMRLHRMWMLGVDVEDEIKNHEEWLRKVRKEIVEKIREQIPRFMEIAEELGLNNNDIMRFRRWQGYSFIYDDHMRYHRSIGPRGFWDYIS